ncbi:WxL protein peptidoglycan domain-containing protein [Actinomadura sp. 9N407]|uniref:WxL protein peptidoglycan domain-containing protein n=1 Tax=Actinomadura sp. 9N407 TaxID=3375154 RepID=UPI0037A37315
MSPRSRIAAAAAAAALATAPGAALAAAPGGAAAPPAPAPANGNGSWSVGPVNRSAALAARPNFALEAPPGETVRDAVRITNLTAAPITFRLYGADAYNTPRDAGFALRTAEEKARDVGAWISLKSTDLKVPARTAKEVPFTVKVPAHATPGEHIGGIVALNTAVESVQESGGARVGIRRAVGARVYLRVSGPLTPGLRPDGLTVARTEPLVPFLNEGRGTIRYTVVNTGNQRIAPTARVWATGLFGREIEQWPDRRLPEILPGQRTEITLPWNGTPPIEAVTVRVELTDGNGIRARTQFGFTTVPWAALIVLAGSVFLMWSVLPRLIRRWRERAGLGGPDETGVFL